MNRKRSLGLMKIACVITLALGIVLFGVVAPAIIMKENTILDGVGQMPVWFDLTYVELVGVLCFLSLWQAWKICKEIGRDNSFSHENAKSLNRISKYMMIACAMMAFALILCFTIIQVSMLVLSLVVLGTCIALIFALFASAMAQLIEAGAALKDENDLTI